MSTESLMTPALARRYRNFVPALDMIEWKCLNLGVSPETMREALAEFVESLDLTADAADESEADLILQMQTGFRAMVEGLHGSALSVRRFNIRLIDEAQWQEYLRDHPEDHVSYFVFASRIIARQNYYKGKAEEFLQQRNL